MNATVSVTNVSCYGDNNGSINLTVTNGIQPYTYTWSNGSTTEDISGLSAGTYSVTVTDANGCTIFADENVSQPDSLDISATGGDPTCAGNDGDIDITVTGGTGPYTFSWSNGETTEDIDSLGFGSYTVTVTDANGCSKTVTFTLAVPVDPDFDVLREGVGCNGGNTGSLNLTMTAGAGPFIFNWSNGATTEDISGLAAGIYTVTVTGSNSCTATGQDTIFEPPALTQSAIIDNESCNPGNDGAIDVSVSGGTGAYTYTWSNGATTEDISGLDAGTYTVTVTDANGCISMQAYAVDNDDSEVVFCSVNVTSVSCNGGSNGAIDVTPCGGITPYSYLWSNSATSEDISGLSAGTYTLTITEGNGCSRDTSFIVSQPEVLSASCSGTNVSCNGGNNGSASASVSGGISPYSYLWSNGSTDASISNLSAGNYCVTVTDANGCTATCCYNVTEPSALSATCSGTDVSCNGGNNGSASVTASGGTPPYTYSWSNGSTDASLSGIASGNYCVTVTDANGCAATCCYNVTEPALLTADCSGTNVSCNGSNNGSAAVSVSGGTMPYTYSWSNGSTDASLTGLATGNYCVTVTDANGCTATCCYIVTEPDELSITGNVNDAVCNGSNNGSIDITVSGGSAPYSYLWSNGQTTEDISNLAAGVYTIIVTDASGCSSSETYAVSEPGSMSISGNVTHVECNGNSTGAIDITVSGGVQPYTYQWSNGSTTEDLISMPAGIYNVTVTDTAGCMVVQSFTINQPDPLSLSALVNDVLCGGDNSGSIDLTVTGGTAPYTFTWSNGETTEDISNLYSGTYEVTVTDANGCFVYMPYTVMETMPLSASYNYNNVSCYGESDGSIDLTITDGNPPYTFSWSNGETTEDISDLVAATYTVTITDANGCELLIAIDIYEPPQIVAGFQVTNITCHGGSDGTALVEVSGGVPPYSYLWSNGDTTDVATGLSEGYHSVIITDATGCDTVVTVYISEPPLLEAVISVSDASCNGYCNGSATAAAFGGTPPYSYLWDDGQSQTTSTATGLCAGTYTCQITDAAGCIKYVVVTVDEPAVLNVGATVNDVDCFGGNDGEITLIVTGGTSPYIFQWSNGQTTQTATGLSAGSYTVTVTDANGCSLTSTFSVLQPSQMSATIQVQNVKCNGGNDGTLNVIVSGGTGPYSYLWNTNPAATTAFVNNVTAGTYTVLITDSKGCTITANATVTQPAPLNGNGVVTQATCNGGSNGSVVLSTTGGTPAYTYIWSNGNTTSSITGLGAGVYTVTITDSKNCTKVETYVVSQPGGLSVTGSVSHVSCNGGANGSIVVTVSGGSSPYTFTWSNGETTSTISNLPAGTYTVTVTDANGCVVISSFQVNESPALTCICNANVHHVSCYGGNDGSISISVSGGTPPYTFTWSNGATTQNVSGLTAGTYTVTITDANGCQKSAVVQINQPSQLYAFASGSGNVCSGANNGSASVMAVGGTPPYTYLWSNGATTATVTGLGPGTYVVTVTDANGCTAQSSVTLSQNPTLTCSTTHTNVSCYGGQNGTATANPVGGTSPYTYLWSTSPPKTTKTAIGLAAGTYTVTVTDAAGCTTQCSATITQPSQLIALYLVTNVACNGGSTGAIDLSVTGGTPPYTYVWSTGATTQDVSGLSAGIYVVTISDSKGCSVVANIVVTQPGVLACYTSVTNVSCFGGNNGTASVNVSGGTAPYTYQWSNGGSNSSISGIAAGTYTVLITDANNCTTQCVAIVTQPTLLTCTIAPCCDSIKCKGDTNGKLSANANGGTPPYSYYWNTNPVQTTQVASGLGAGTYSVIITDANGCSTTCSYTLSEPDSLLCSVSATDVSCNGGSDGTATATVTGGTPPYVYVWSTNPSQTTQTATGLSAGFYQVFITDAHGCTTSCSVVVGEPAVLSCSIQAVNVLCYGQCSGALTVNPAGGTAPYTYLWSNGATTQTITGLCAGSYSVTVTDANSCIAMCNADVTEPALLTCSLAVTDVTCNGGNDGEITANVTGGVSPYSFNWSNGATTQTITGLSAGVYTVTVTDQNGCTTVCSDTVHEPDPLTCTVVVLNGNDCVGDNDGELSANVTGGVPPYSYLWSNGQTTQTATGLSAGTYTVTVTDANGCTTSCSGIINDPPELTCTINGVNTSCGLNNGSATVIPSGGTPPFSFLWSNGQTTQTATGLAAGIYTATITDANGCSTSCSVTISSSSTMSCTVTKINASCGQNNGSATVFPTGGTPPYSYLWSNGQTTQTATGLAPGNYSVTVTDVNGCTTQCSVSIGGGPQVFVTCQLVKKVTCFGGNDGKLKAIPSGGTPPYSYLWSNGQTTQTATGLTAGTYTVTVTDANGCTGVTQCTVTQNSQIVATFTKVKNPKCNGSCTGQAKVIPSGGVSPYKYLWSNGQTTALATGLCAGTYTVTVTDKNGCSKSFSIILTQPAPFTVTTSKSDVSCNGLCNGTATVIVSGATPPYTYTWNTSPVQTNATATGLCAGNYTVTIKDNKGCTTTRNFTITQPPALSATTSQTNNSSCGVSCNGTATVNVSGGTAPYTYAWNTSPVQTNATATGLCGGSYSVTITDANGCTLVKSFVISGAPALTATTSHTNNTSCSGSCNGTASVVVSGGTAPYTYSWNTSPVQTNATATGLCAGSYSVTITDASGCTLVKSFVISGTSPLSATTSQTNITACSGLCSGTASVSVTGGTPPYTYSWNTSPVQTNSTATGLCAGSYSVTITDANGCTLVKSFVITAAPSLMASTSQTNNTSCSSCNGTASVTVSGGKTPYTFSWNTSPVQTNATATGLCPGSYSVTITDADGCTLVKSFVITGTSAMSCTISGTNPTCYGSNNGSATVTVIGGTGPFTYLWSTGATTQTISGLDEGNYSVTVTSATGCTTQCQVVLTEPDQLKWGITLTHVQCYGFQNGTATVFNVYGGTPPYTFSWNTNPVQTTTTATGLGPGFVSVTITDANGCTGVGTVLIGEPQPLNCTTTSTPATNCSSNGTATSNPTGGTTPYSYLWSNNKTTKTITGLAPGVYTVTVTDYRGCITTCMATVGGNAVTLTLFSPVYPGGKNIRCNGESNGSIDLSVNTGTSPFTYLWSNGATTQDISGLSAGTYTVTVSDAAGCTKSGNITLTQPAVLNATFTIDPVSCKGGNDGSATANPTGGTQPYSYIWNNGQTTQTATGLSAGVHTVTVSDLNGCATVKTVTVTEPATLLAVTGTKTNVSCNGGCNGSINATVSGGVSPYGYLWNDGATTEDRSGLCAGTYTVTVTDAYGCQQSMSKTITQPSAISISISKTDVTVHGGNDGTATANVSGGTPSYSYSWNTVPVQSNQTATGLIAGTYSVTVTDNNGCTKNGSVVINQPPPPREFNPVLLVAEPSVTIYPNPGNGQFTVEFSNAGNAEKYLLTVYDVAGKKMIETTGQITSSWQTVNYDFSNVLAKGIYVLQTDIGSAVKQTKLVVQ